MSTEAGPDPRTAARRLATFFVLAGSVWVLLTDLLLYASTDDPRTTARLETAKGWTFVVLGALFVYGVTRRVLERSLRARALTAAIVESIGDGLLLLDRDRRIAYANPAALRMLGCGRAEDLVGMGASEFAYRFRVTYPDGSVVPPSQFVSQRAFDEGGPLHYTAVLHLPNRRDLVISSTAAPVETNTSEAPHLVVSVMHDITASYRLEEMRNQFFAAAAHSLKTPIAIVKAHTQILAQEASPPLQRAIAAIQRQCDRIDRLVQNLLVLSRGRSHSLRLHAREVPLRPIVERALRDMQASFPRRDIRADLAATPTVYADQERLAVVVRNVLDEALRRSLADSPIALAVRQQERAAEIAVRYQPLPAEEQLVDSYGEYDEVGIGRCVARMITEAHAGRLTETSVGPETVLSLRLPNQKDARGTG